MKISIEARARLSRLWAYRGGYHDARVGRRDIFPALMENAADLSAHDRGRRKGNHCQGRNKILAKVREDMWLDTEGTAYAVDAWLAAVCGALWSEHTGYDVGDFLRSVRYRSGVHVSYPEEDSPAELWLFFRDAAYTTGELIRAGQVLARACPPLAGSLRQHNTWRNK